MYDLLTLFDQITLGYRNINDQIDLPHTYTCEPQTHTRGFSVALHSFLEVMFRFTPLIKIQGPGSLTHS